MTLATEDLEATSSTLQPVPPLKLDKSLRRALLRALSDLEEQSAEQHANSNSEEKPLMDEANPRNINSAEEKEVKTTFGKSTFSFNSFPNDEETASEDKLQNSSFIEIEKFVSADYSPVTLKTALDNTLKLKGFLVRFLKLIQTIINKLSVIISKKLFYV